MAVSSRVTDLVANLLETIAETTDVLGRQTSALSDADEARLVELATRFAAQLAAVQEALGSQLLRHDEVPMRNHSYAEREALEVRGGGTERMCARNALMWRGAAGHQQGDVCGREPS